MEYGKERLKNMETRILYHKAIDCYSVQLKLPAMGWVTVESFLSKEKAEQVASWLQ